MHLVRLMPAPRARVFETWWEPDFIKPWVASGAMTVPAAPVDFRLGSLDEIHMQGDELFVTRGESREIVPDEKLVFTRCCSAFDLREALATISLKAFIAVAWKGGRM
ncbi:uncharacterized protein YndB with AHSA1/START domain [Paraburkholderia sp. GAS448]|uniref:SRPBCC domain-containing protein n=1 Tax=Paraburkholderia sp. GAS448 TaxID=3035136 RepID=UPI003D233046